MAGISTLIARFALPALLSAALACGAPSAARAADSISEQDAHAIGVQAYLYFYPLVTMDLTRKQLTNVVEVRRHSCADEHVRQHPGIPHRRT